MDAAEMIEGYISAGIGVFPLHSVRNSMCTCGRPAGKGPGECHSPAKHPILGLAHPKGDPLRNTCHGECGKPGHGLYDATTDPGQVSEWLAKYPGCNWAVRPPEGVLVLDIDPRNGGDVELRKLEQEHGTLPSTLTAQTGSGGLHIWLSYNGPAKGKLCTGVDIKTNKGYLVAPPSTHICGGTYSWINQSPAAYAPQWVKARMNPPIRRFAPRPGEASGTGIAYWVQWYSERASAGDRNNLLYWVACRVHEKGLDPAPLIEAATAAGHNARMAANTVASAANAAPRAAAAPHPSAAEFLRRTPGKAL